MVFLPKLAPNTHRLPCKGWCLWRGLGAKGFGASLCSVLCQQLPRCGFQHAQMARLSIHKLEAHPVTLWGLKRKFGRHKGKFQSLSFTWMRKSDEKIVLALTEPFFRTSVKSPQLSVPHFPSVPRVTQCWVCYWGWDLAAPSPAQLPALLPHVSQQCPQQLPGMVHR